MRARKGFTLIELVVVIAILGILAGIAIPRFMDSIETARGAKLLADLRSIESAGTVYYTKNGKYPTVSTESALGRDKDFIEDYFGSWPLSTGGYAIVQGYNGVNYRYNLSNGSIPYEYAYNSQGAVDKSYEGRATIDQKTLEHYLGGEAGRGHGPVAIVSAASLSSSEAERVKDHLQDALDKAGITIGAIDSTSTNGTKVQAIVNYLTHQGISLSGCDWAIRGSGSNYSIYVFPKLTGTGKVNATVYNIKDNNVTSSSQTVVNVKNNNGTLKIDR